MAHQVDDTMTGTPGGSSRASEQLRQHAGTVREDVRELGRLTRDAAQEKLSDVKKAAQDYYEHGREKAGELEKSLEGYIRENPMKSLLMAAGAGLILGFWMSRR